MYGTLTTSAAFVGLYILDAITVSYIQKIMFHFSTRLKLFCKRWMEKNKAGKIRYRGDHKPVKVAAAINCYIMEATEGKVRTMSLV